MYALKTLFSFRSRSRCISVGGKSLKSLQHLYPNIDNAIANDESPESSEPKANTGCSVGRILNKDAPSLFIAPILVKEERIE